MKGSPKVIEIEKAIGKTLTRFPATDEACEAAIAATLRWARMLADTLPPDKREAWACCAYQVADHLATPEK